MDAKELSDHIGYCGLVCLLCHEAGKCGGCKSQKNTCARYLSQQGCYQYTCCTSRGLAGCWECDEAPCDKDMFSEHHDIRNRTFIKVAKEEGIVKLAQYVLTNQHNGILYGWNKDYDNLGSAEAVTDLLHNGLNSKVWQK